MEDDFATATPPAIPFNAIKLKWSDSMEHVALSTLLAQAEIGKRADSGFKKEAWLAVATAVQRAYIGPSIRITVQQCKSKIDNVYKKP
jgi:hypothetical protein